MDYPIANRALSKWSASKLVRGSGEKGELFSFSYEGSSCNNGGTAFKAVLHVELSGSGFRRIIEKAWIEIPEDEKEAASAMCAAPGSGAEEAEPFFRKLSAQANFVGRDLETVILEKVPENFAGCFCGQPHVNQKWKIVLSTIHYALFQE